MSFLFPLRVSPETLQSRIASGEDALADFPPQKFMAIIGVRAIAGTPLLLAKFSWRRKNIRSGCILRRQCLCDEKEELAQMLCPIHIIRPLIIAGQPKHGLLSPSLTRPNFNRILNRNMLSAGFPGADWYSSHCFRRGPTQELQLAGSSGGRIKSAGCWAAMGFRSYIDTQMTDALKITRLIASSLTNSDSEDDGEILLRAPVKTLFGRN